MDEVIHMLGGEKKIARVIDLTAADGIVARICLRRRIFFMGMGFTAVHIAKRSGFRCPPQAGRAARLGQSFDR